MTELSKKRIKKNAKYLKRYLLKISLKPTVKQCEVCNRLGDSDPETLSYEYCKRVGIKFRCGSCKFPQYSEILKSPTRGNVNGIYGDYYKESQKDQWIRKSDDTVFYYYEDWINETISWQNPNGTKGEGTRKSLGLDVSRKEYLQYYNTRLELIKCGAIKDLCPECQNNKNTSYSSGLWSCSKCNSEWDPLKIKFRGM